MSPSCLVLRPGALGDFILTLPVLYALRKHCPKARLELMAPAFASELLEHRGIADRIRPADAPGLHTFFSPALQPDTGLRTYFSSFQWILSYWADPDGIFSQQLRSSVRGKLAVHPPKPAPGNPRHVSEYLAEPLATFGIPFVPCRHLLLPALEIHRQAAASLALALQWPPQPPWVMIHPGSGSERKNWPASHFAELARQIREDGRFLPILIEGQGDRAAASQVRTLLGGRSFPWLTQPSLTELVGLLDRAAAYVGNDSGVSHLAAAAGAPSVVLFGPTNPAQWRPLGPHVKVLGPEIDLARIRVSEVLETLFVIASGVEAAPKAP